MNERDSIECLRYKSVIEESEKKCINRLKRDLKMEWKIYKFFRFKKKNLNVIYNFWDFK